MSITPQSADVTKVLAMTFPNVMFDANAQASARGSVQAGRIIAFSGGSGDNSVCTTKYKQASMSATKGLGLGVGLTETATSSLVHAGTIAASSVTKAIPIIGSVIDSILSIVNVIGAHHAAAVALEDQTICQIVPQVNAAFDTLDAGVSNGQISLSDALTALDNIQAGYNQGVSAIIKESPGKCNAACVVDGFVREQIALRKLEYASMVPPATTPVTAVKGAAAAIKASVTQYWWAWLMAGAIIILFRKVEA